MSDYSKLGRPEMRIFSFIFFGFIIFVTLVADILPRNISFHSVRILQRIEAERQPVILLESLAATNEAYGAADQESSLASFNITVDKRIAWFKNDKFRDLDAFRSTRIMRQFDARMRKFLDGDERQGQCQVQLFMTWISPASSFGRRQFSAMESIFKAHPNACLIILHTREEFGGFIGVDHVR